SPPTMRGLFSTPRPDRRRFPGLPRLRTSSEVPQGRLAFDLANVHGGADLLLDLHGERRSDCRDAGEVVRVRLLQIPQGFESALVKSATADSAHAAERYELQQFFLYPVLHLSRESGQGPDFLLVEDPAEF